MSGLGCIDESGAAVDGWTILKSTNGYKYFIYDKTSGSFVESPYELDQTENGAVMQTLAPLYDVAVNGSFGYLFYNDNYGALPQIVNYCCVRMNIGVRPSLM